MKTKVSLKMFVLSVVLLMTSFVASARSYDGQLVYNPVEENGVMVGQTVYKMNGNGTAPKRNGKKISASIIHTKEKL